MLSGLNPTANNSSKKKKKKKILGSIFLARGRPEKVVMEVRFVWSIAECLWVPRCIFHHVIFCLIYCRSINLATAPLKGVIRFQFVNHIKNSHMNSIFRLLHIKWRNLKFVLGEFYFELATGSCLSNYFDCVKEKIVSDTGKTI